MPPDERSWLRWGGAVFLGLETAHFVGGLVGNDWEGWRTFFENFAFVVVWQLAARAGATVVASALPEDERYLRELGVSELLPRDGDLAAAARERRPDGFDAVLDLVNYAPDVPATLVKEGGRVASPTGAAGEGPGRTLVMAAPTPENLERLAHLLADGTLRVPIQATYELAQAPDALTELPTTHTQGKLAIRVT